ncbi:MAG: 30S ribosomal protein S16 [bacterium]
MVRLRLKRLGRRNRPHYRIAAFDARSARDGKALDEDLGSYDPLVADDTQKVRLNRERIIFWLDRGAQPTEAVANILKRNGIYLKTRGASRRRRKKQPPATESV